LTALCLAAAPGRAGDPQVDARVSTFAQYFQQALVPGQPGAVARIEPAFPITASAYVRAQGIEIPNTVGTITTELAAWGSLGPLDGRSADGDVTSVWAQFRTNAFRIKIGRQVTLPGSSRYVRFDGLSLGVTLGTVDVDTYGGFVALPRWNLPRGATLLGFVGDGLKDPLLLEAQNRVGQFVVGARVSVRLPFNSRIGLAFHEQHDQIGAAWRVISVDGNTQPLGWLSVGTRVSVDVMAGQVSEARAWVDLTRIPRVPLAFDYSYQRPSLLLPQTSVLAAFGGAAWHELGAETSILVWPGIKVTGRAAGQAFEGGQLGARGQLRARWTPGIDGRLMVLGEVNRVLVSPSGYTELRAATRWKAAQTITTSLDAAVFFYDAPVNGVTNSMTGVAAVEWAPKSWVRAMLSATVMRTPWAQLETQGLARLVFELDPTSGGGLP
jgi:hypothetical protein